MKSIGLALVLLCGLARPAASDAIFVTSSFSGGAFDAIGMTPFDSSQGTLDSVAVRILGTLSVSGSTLPHLVPVGVTPVPTPYDYRVDVTQDFEGLAGGYFDLHDHTTFSMIGHASGSGEPFTLVTTFAYAFDFDDITDLIGFTIPSVSSSVGTVVPAFSVSAARADFTGTGVIEEVDLIQSATSAIVGGAAVPAPLIGTFLASGLITVTYEYTPAPEPPSVPEPATLSLLGVAAAAAAARRALHYNPASCGKQVDSSH
jgi:hypothetical protein